MSRALLCRRTAARGVISVGSINDQHAGVRTVCLAATKPVIIKPMLKRFLQMLIVALTLQLTWGVSSAYCMHESGKASQHVGHHQHQHQSSNADDDDGDDAKPSKIGGDPDCATCTHSSVGVFAFDATQLLLSTSIHEIPPNLARQPAPYLGAPERPQWMVAA